MKKLLLMLFFLIKSQTALGVLYDYYKQNSPIVLYTTDNNAKKTIENMLQAFGLQHEQIDTEEQLRDDHLYLIVGDIKKCVLQTLPKYYIVYQTENLSLISDNDLRILHNAAGVWDAHWSNINYYKNQIAHWYYLPNDKYEFIDPVLLSCFLPLNALQSYKELLALSNNRDTDFSSHIPPLFCHCILNNPDVIVESGIRWGDGSTIAFAKAMQLLKNTHLIGLDIEDCSRHYIHIQNSHFLLMNDVQFPSYFKTMHLPKKLIDMVFIDTSHQYEHTLQEIKAFNTVLAQQGLFIFHDSNVAIPDPVRINGTVCPSGMGNPKGVTDGLKKHFGVRFDEGKYINTYVTAADGCRWHLVNYPYCYGLAYVKKVKR